MAKIGCKVWMEHGALSYYECVGDELNLPWGMPFSKLCKLKSDETAIFAFVVYKSKAHRNSVNAKVHKDKRMCPEQFNAMPFDMKRFAAGGFHPFITGAQFALLSVNPIFGVILAPSAVLTTLLLRSALLGGPEREVQST